MRHEVGETAAAEESNASVEAFREIVTGSLSDFISSSQTIKDEILAKQVVSLRINRRLSGFKMPLTRSFSL